MSGSGDDPKAALAALAFGLGASTSYVVQRIGSYLGGEAAPTSVLMSAHVPFFWRVGLSVFHGVLLAIVLGLALSPDVARRWAGRLSTLALPLVFALVAASFLVP